MADTKITALTDIVTPVGADVMPIVDDVAGTPVTKKVTVTALAAAIETILALTQADILNLTTADSPMFTGINVGHASDTTLTRDSAGVLAVEGNRIMHIGGVDLPIADGGTGASTAATARTALGVGTGDTPTFAGNVVTGFQSFGGPRITGALTASIAADQNNYSPAGGNTARYWLMTASGAARTITGLAASNFTQGDMLFIMNDNTNQLNLAHGSASSSSGNRFGCPNAATYAIRTNGGVWVVYDPANFAANPFRLVAP